MNKNEFFNLENAINNGTIFKDLYKPYKMHITKIIPENEKEKCMLEIQKLSLAKQDLKLYLDIYPNNVSLINMFNEYEQEYKRIKKEFEEKYYLLDPKGKKDKWTWIDNNWPWEEMK